jgi:hypothetical protein
MLYFLRKDVEPDRKQRRTNSFFYTILSFFRKNQWKRFVAKF